MYYLKDNVEVDFGIIKRYDIAKRIEINYATLTRILNRKMGCSKVIANYISMLNYKGSRYSDRHILDYFYKKEK